MRLVQLIMSGHLISDVQFTIQLFQELAYYSSEGRFQNISTEFQGKVISHHNQLVVDRAQLSSFSMVKDVLSIRLWIPFISCVCHGITLSL